MAAGRVGIIVRSGPYMGRSGRDQLDLALSAATLGLELELVFMGQGVLHLFDGKRPLAAGFADTWRGWKGLPGLTGTSAWIHRPDPGSRFELPELLLDAGLLDDHGLQQLLDRCQTVLVV